jgi:tetratricopeptide (TPR) repeat protein
MLVVGQDGLPLNKEGALTPKLQKAKEMQRVRPLQILLEAEFLNQLGLESPATGLQRLTTVQLSQVLRVPGSRVRRWVKLGLVTPVETVFGVHYFDFRQVSWAKTLCDLTRAKVSIDQIRRSLEQLKEWLPAVDQSLAQLAVLEKDGRLLVRCDEGQLAEPTGQGLLDFAEESSPVVRVTSGPQTADEWFQRAYEHERAGSLAEAEKEYRQALLLGGPDAETCFNLANVLYARGQKTKAAERFRQALEIEPDSPEVWNNLGNVLAALGELDEAAEALRRATALDPAFADARYNLADTLEQLGRSQDAIGHWKAYLHLDPTGSWADYARSRLAAHRGA